jgi:FkbM family methyltransferase
LDWIGWFKNTWKNYLPASRPDEAELSPQTNPVLGLASLAARLLPSQVKEALYRSGPLASALRRGLNRAAPQGVTQVQVAAGGLEGLSLWLDLQAEKEYWLGTYEPALQRAIIELVKPGWVAYDVGANIGYISLLLARQVEAHGKVFAFEALPENTARLQANMSLNEIGSRVQVMPAAVVDRSGQVEFLLGLSSSMGKAKGSSGRQESPNPESVQVPGLSLDDFVYQQRNPPPHVVKMDIEGGEILALPGMQHILTERHPLILIEIHGPEAARTAWKLLSETGYQISRMSSTYPPLARPEDLDWKAYLVAH